MSEPSDNDNPLAFATFEELIEEIGRRANACCVAYDIDKRNGGGSTINFAAMGPGTACFGLAVLMKEKMAIDLMNNRFGMGHSKHDEEDDDDE